MGSLIDTRPEALWQGLFSMFLMSYYLIDVNLFIMMIVGISASEVVGMCLDVGASMIKQFKAFAELDKRTEEG